MIAVDLLGACTVAAKSAGQAALLTIIRRKEGEARAKLVTLVHTEHGNPRPFHNPEGWFAAKYKADALLARRVTCRPH